MSPISKPSTVILVAVGTLLCLLGLGYAGSGTSRIGRGAGTVEQRVDRIEREARPWATYITTTVADSTNAASFIRGGDFWFHRRLGRYWVVAKFDDDSLVSCEMTP